MEIKLCNKLKRNLKEGKVQMGAFVTSPSPEVAEVLAATGFDFVIIDAEHGGSTLETVIDMIRGAEAYGMSTVVRAHDDTPKIVSRYMDVGAYGIQVPMVHTAEQAAKIVEATKFWPEGKRGMSGGRGAKWGYIPEYREAVNRESFIAVMCESVEGVKNIEEIVRVPGIDAVFIGAYDLSQDMGIPGDVMSEPMEEAIAKVLKACQDAKVIPGIVAPTVEMARKRIAQGFTYVTLFDDMVFFAESAAKRLAEVKA